MKRPKVESTSQSPSSVDEAEGDASSSEPKSLEQLEKLLKKSERRRIRDRRRQIRDRQRRIDAENALKEQQATLQAATLGAVRGQNRVTCNLAEGICFNFNLPI
jgi:hypothetical protein